jgi:hypothetical protein
MLFHGDGVNRVLLIGKEIVHVGNLRTIEYTGIYNEVETKFIGMIECPKIRDSVTVGIYVKPLFIFIDRWYKVSFRPPTGKYFKYPQLLILPGERDNNSLAYLHTVTPVTNFPKTDLTLEIS